MDLTKEDIKEMLRTADCVCFDVDSTICEDEGIDELASFLGVGAQVKKLTLQAMGGSMTFQESLKNRLKIINPSQERLSQFLKSHTSRITPGAKELVDILHSRGCNVYLISGGFFEIIEPAANSLGIQSSNVFANNLLFYYTGEFFGIDENQPTCRSGGKANVIDKLKKEYGYQRIIMIGDGATDLEACPPANAFIGFGGNVTRSVVKERAKWFVHSFEDIIDELK